MEKKLRLYTYAKNELPEMSKALERHELSRKTIERVVKEHAKKKYHTKL